MAEVNRITRLGVVNAYLVREEDGLTLIDTMIALRLLEPARLAPGHGKVVESPLDAMERATAIRSL